MHQNRVAALSPIDLTPEGIELWLANAVSEMWGACLVNPVEQTVLKQIVAAPCCGEQLCSEHLDAIAHKAAT
jgi:hypothetical protein